MPFVRTSVSLMRLRRGGGLCSGQLCWLIATSRGLICKYHQIRIVSLNLRFLRSSFKRLHRRSLLRLQVRAPRMSQLVEHQWPRPANWDLNVNARGETSTDRRIVILAEFHDVQKSYFPLMSALPMSKLSSRELFRFAFSHQSQYIVLIYCSPYHLSSLDRGNGARFRHLSMALGYQQPSRHGCCWTFTWPQIFTCVALLQAVAIITLER